MNYKSGYAINGMWFFNGINSNGKIHIEEYVNKEFPLRALFETLKEEINKKYDVIIPMQIGFLSSSFMDYGHLIPSYHFQCSFKARESAVKASNDILNEIDSLLKKGKSQTIIIIAEGDVKDIGDPDVADGMAYIRSGTFLESPEVWINKWNENNRIFILEGDYLVKPIVEIKRYKDI